MNIFNLGKKRVWVMLGLVLCLGLSASAEDAASSSAPLESEAAQDGGNWDGWYFCIGNSNNHPKLHDASNKIDREINDVFRTMAPGFDDVKTFSDQRDDLMIWTPFVILGKSVSDRWNVFLQMGYTQGYVRSKADDMSLVLLPLHTDVRFDRSTFYAGLGTEFFPWGMPESREYHGLKDRLVNAKPLIGGTFCWNYLTADCDVKAGLKPFGNFINIEEHEVWRTTNIAALTGVAIPVNESTNLFFNASYNFFLKYGDDFSGPSFSSFWQFKF